jgi:hypothetical protein
VVSRIFLPRFLVYGAPTGVSPCFALCQVMAKRSRSPLHVSVEGRTSESEAENEDQSRSSKKKLRLSLAKKGKCRAQDQERSEFVSGAKLETVGKKFVPKNTESSSGRSPTICRGGTSAIWYMLPHTSSLSRSSEAATSVLVTAAGRTEVPPTTSWKTPLLEKYPNLVYVTPHLISLSKQRGCHLCSRHRCWKD